MATLAMISGAGAENRTKGVADTDPIHITADRMVTQTDANVAEFIGNVHAAQGDTRIRADRLYVYYTSGETEEKAGAGPVADAIEKVVAEGNVAIDFQDKTASCEEAVYRAMDGTLVMTGEPARIESEGSHITGGRITLNRTTGEIIVSGKADQQVEAVFTPNEEKPGIDSSAESGRLSEE